MRIDVDEVTPDRDDLVAAVVQTRNTTDREINPDDPPIGPAELRSDLFARTIRRHTRAWVARIDGEPVGDVSYDLEDDDENRHIAGTDWLAVVPAHRRTGVADALLRESLDVLAEDGRTSLLLYSYLAEPDVGRIYAERLGLVEKTEERCSRLRMEDLAEDLVDGWLAEGRARDDGYRLVQFGARCPDDLLDAYVEAIAAMEDAPTDDLEWTPPPIDHAVTRSREETWTHKDLVVARSLVLDPDGRGAGVSELFVSRHRPTLAWQGDTGVVAAHRGRGLGRWLKAENLRYAQRLSPGFEVVETYNAQSNPWMLDINVAMGFRPHVIWRGFQGDLAHARAVVTRA